MPYASAPNVYAKCRINYRLCKSIELGSLSEQTTEPWQEAYSSKTLQSSPSADYQASLQIKKQHVPNQLSGEQNRRFKKIGTCHLISSGAQPLTNRVIQQGNSRQCRPLNPNTTMLSKLESSMKREVWSKDSCHLIADSLFSVYNGYRH